MPDADSETIAYYDSHASSFVAGTVGACMTDVLPRFMRKLPKGGNVLDWGCGSGCDSLALREMGYDVTSVDASSAMAVAALDATGTVARVEAFDDLSEIEAYDGIWACASLLHVRPNELPNVLDKAADALRQDGVLYCSFKHGRFAGHRDGRWFIDLDEHAL